MTGTTKAAVLVVALGAAGAVAAVVATRPHSTEGVTVDKVTVSNGRPTDKCEPTHCVSKECETCTAANCQVTDACEGLDASGFKLCQEIYACFNDPENKCVVQGDSLKCWCGTNPTTCVTDNTPPTRANGPCLDKVFAGAASQDATVIRKRFVDAAYPLGRAVLLTQCRGTFCKNECGVP